MIDTDVAVRLRDGGLRWVPAKGDWFFIAHRGMDDEHFVLSDMTIELYGDQIGFNGTTEWALDLVDQRAAVWLPREHQLRALLGGTFRGLEQVGTKWQVQVQIGGVASSFLDVDVEKAYGQALLQLVVGD